ncbi:hypothetical protein M3Y99_00577400 [Aphelenchoides fujianensis]|nr:hypothetical protein M3Y99_00577400 [Aphelenchoides fujianensis]
MTHCPTGGSSRNSAALRRDRNIASFLPDGSPAGVLFELSECAGWTVGRVHVRIHGFRVVPKPPLVQTS